MSKYTVHFTTAASFSITVDADAPDECFAGTRQSARTGWSPITTLWQGDYYTWDYAEVSRG